MNELAELPLTSSQTPILQNSLPAVAAPTRRSAVCAPGPPAPPAVVSAAAVFHTTPALRAIPASLRPQDDKAFFSAHICCVRHPSQRQPLWRKRIQVDAFHATSSPVP